MVLLRPTTLATRSPSSGPHAVAARAHRARCYRCFKAAATCICGSLERVENATGIVILQHPRERFHAIGTVRFARLGLSNVRVLPCLPGDHAGAVQAQLPAGAALLYPSEAARDLATLPAEERPRHLVILDGTWTHARKLYRAQRWLHELPHLRLRPSEPSRYRLRREPRHDYVATIEAIVAALRILEPRLDGLDGLLASFAAMIDRQAAFSDAAALRVVRNLDAADRQPIEPITPSMR